MKYRHEWKHIISYGDMLTIRARLSAVAKNDIHAVDGKYKIRSMYFDNAYDKALREKIDGVNAREKFRIRYYNDDTSLIFLEKKCKINGLCLKESTVLTKEQAESISHGIIIRQSGTENRLIDELRFKMTNQGLKPKTIVDYTREPFVFPAGNVRVTLDYDIRTGLNQTDFLNPHCVTVPAAENAIILEVKWDEFLPDIIREAVQLPNCRSTAFSKYAVCRTYD